VCRYVGRDITVVVGVEEGTLALLDAVEGKLARPSSWPRLAGLAWPGGKTTWFLPPVARLARFAKKGKRPFWETN